MFWTIPNHQYVLAAAAAVVVVAAPGLLHPEQVTTDSVSAYISITPV